MTPNQNQSAGLRCSNCGTFGEQTDERTEALNGQQRPVLQCPTCRAKWTVLERLHALLEIAELVSESTAARGMDAFATRQFELSASDWAELTGRDRSTVSRNVRRADGGGEE